MDNVIAQSVLTKCDGQYRNIKYREDIMAQIANMGDDDLGMKLGRSWTGRPRGNNKFMISGTLDTNDFINQLVSESKPTRNAPMDKEFKLNETTFDPNLRDKLLDGDEENKVNFFD